MGVSTDAVVVYGYVWGDEKNILNSSGDPDWVDVVLKLRGIPDPWAAFPSEIEQLRYEQRRAASDRWVAEHRAEIDAHYAAKRAIEEEFGVTIDYHGSDQWQVPMVIVKDAGKRAARGYPEILTADDLAVGEDWSNKLDVFVDTLGIDISEAKGPGWFLVSWWG